METVANICPLMVTANRQNTVSTQSLGYGPRCQPSFNLRKQTFYELFVWGVLLRFIFDNSYQTLTLISQTDGRHYLVAEM